MRGKICTETALKCYTSPDPLLHLPVLPPLREHLHAHVGVGRYIRCLFGAPFGWIGKLARAHQTGKMGAARGLAVTPNAGVLEQLDERRRARVVH